jgi:hypothetical protein
VFRKVITLVEKKIVTKADIQRKNTKYFVLWQDFIARNAYQPRAIIVGAERERLSDEAYKLEVRLGRWGAHVAQYLKGHVPYAIDWEYATQQAEFVKLWQKTPTWQQKNNTDNLAACRKFSRRRGYRPRQEISDKERKLMSAAVWQTELELGSWAAHTASRINNAKKGQRDWQYPCGSRQNL